MSNDMVVRKIRSLFNCCLVVLCLMVLLGDSVAAATDTKSDEMGKKLIRSEEMPIEQAIERISMGLKARIIIFGSLSHRNVSFSENHRSDLERLKSILKGSSYAIVYNDPTHSYDCYGEPPSTPESRKTSAAFTYTTESENKQDGDVTSDPREKLLKRIGRLESEIESGEAERFYKRWSKVKDPKYIFNHSRELARLREKLASLE